MTLLAITIGSLLGTLLGNLSILWVIGKIAQNQEKEKLREVQWLQQGYLDLVQRERERLEKYAQMEGWPTGLLLFPATIITHLFQTTVNLFVTDDCPYQSAYNLPDKLVVKMALENAQMLAANFSDEFLAYGGLRKKDGTFYKATHKNHPCTKWGRECQGNIAWMIVHGLAICAEYHRRYGKIHSCLQAHLDAKKLFEQNGGSLQMYQGHTPFVRAMPEEFKTDLSISSVEAYRKYMHTKHYAKWKHNNQPTWWNVNEHHTV